MMMILLLLVLLHVCNLSDKEIEKEQDYVVTCMSVNENI